MLNSNKFWSYFLRKAASVIPLYQSVSANNKSYLHTRKGEYCNFGVSINTNEKIAWVERCFQESGPEGVSESNRKFDHFYNQKNKIQKEYGGQLDWMRLKEKKRSRILTETVPFDLDHQDSWDFAIDKLLDKMSRFIPAIENAYLGLEGIKPGNATARFPNSRSDMGDYLPIKTDADKALEQVSKEVGSPTRENVLKQIEKNCLVEGKKLKANWKMITERNIDLWY